MSNTTKPLFIPLKREYFEAFAEGRKVVEYRRYGARWNERTCRNGRPVVLSLGYGKHRRLRGEVTGFVRYSKEWLGIGWEECYPGVPTSEACGIHIAISQNP